MNIDDETQALICCTEMSLRAEEAIEAGTLETKCIAGEAVFYYPYSHGLMPGHIYSELGIYEYRISRSCEYHFDEWTAEPEEDDEV